MTTGHPPILIAEHLRRVFSQGPIQTEVIHDISLTFDAGEFTAIIGPSGSGKSTLLYLLGALEHPTAGRIVIAGQDLTELDDVQRAHLRNRILGFVFQFHFLLPEFTARENAAMPLLIRGDVAMAKAFAQAESLLRLVGLDDKMASRPGELSGGQNQRVAIARALVNQPRIVFCDEPTGSLDTQSSESVYQLLRQLNAELGQTIIVVTHELAFAERADRVIRVVDGRVESDERRRGQEGERGSQHEKQ